MFKTKGSASGYSINSSTTDKISDKVPAKNPIYIEPKFNTFHSNDRDINKYPNNNDWSIELPETINNIYSVQLIDIFLPRHTFLFINDYQNLAFMVKNINNVDCERNNIFEYKDSNLWDSFIDNYYMLKVPIGTFTGTELAVILSDNLNYMENITNSTDENKWYVYYSIHDGKFYFYYSGENNYEFDFSIQIHYNSNDFYNKNQPIIFNNTANWGLGYYLGFDKKKISLSDTYDFQSLKKYSLLPPLINPSIFTILEKPIFEFALDITNNYRAIITQNHSNIQERECIYFEINNFNNCDEIYPHNSNSNSLYNNTYNGIVKSAFAKIEIDVVHSNSNMMNQRKFYTSYAKNSFYDPIKKLDFKFRFHDGRYVYFGRNQDVNFSLQFNVGTKDQLQKYIINPQIHT